MQDVLKDLPIPIALLALAFSVLVIVAILFQKRKWNQQVRIKGLRLAANHQFLKGRLELQERIMQHTSSEIHDNICQMLSVIKLRLHAMNASGPSGVQINTLIDWVGKSIQDLRILSRELSTNFIEQKPLTSMVQAEVDLINLTHPFQVTFEWEGSEGELSSEKKIMLASFVKECLDTITRSGGKQISIRLTLKTATGCLIIEFNGEGSLTEKATASFARLREIWFAMGAELQVKRQASVGTRIMVTFPHA